MLIKLTIVVDKDVPSKHLLNNLEYEIHESKGDENLFTMIRKEFNDAEERAKRLAEQVKFASVQQGIEELVRVEQAKFADVQLGAVTRKETGGDLSLETGLRNERVWRGNTSFLTPK